MITSTPGYADPVKHSVTQVARLVGVMDERKVFGNSGARFMKELLAEADSRSKKLSARTGAPVQSNGSAAGSAGAL
jgi:hypothetical protein